MKIHVFCWKIQQRDSAPGESAAGFKQYLICHGECIQNFSGSKEDAVKVGVEATCSHFNPCCILREMTKLAGPFGTVPRKPWHRGNNAKTDHIIQLNCGEVCTHASYNTTRKWENVNNWGTKMILLSDKVWLIANNSKSVNGSSSVKRNNLDLCKHFEIYLI